MSTEQFTFSTSSAADQETPKKSPSGHSNFEVVQLYRDQVSKLNELILLAQGHSARCMTPAEISDICWQLSDAKSRLQRVRDQMIDEGIL